MAVPAGFATAGVRLQFPGGCASKQPLDAAEIMYFDRINLQSGTNT
jgi:hypothetical protein